MRVRTERVKDQVAVTETRQALSSRLQGACLTAEDRRKEKGERDGKTRGEKEQGRERENMTDIKGKERRGGKVTKQALCGRIN